MAGTRALQEPGPDRPTRPSDGWFAAGSTAHHALAQIRTSASADRLDLAPVYTLPHPHAPARRAAERARAGRARRAGLRASWACAARGRDRARDARSRHRSETSGPEHWTDWPGRWGETEPGEVPGEAHSPCSPAAPCSKDHANYFFAPWTGVTCEAGAACPARTKQPEPFSCNDWFGYSVAALACEPRAMRRALRHRGLGSRGGFTIRLVDQRRKAATAPGLAQVVGHPMSPGEDAELTGTVPTGTTILVHLQTAHGLLTAVFDKLAGFRRRAVIVVRRHGRVPVVFMMRGRHRQTATSLVREATLPRD
jgi:hypothetical protein